MIQDRENAEWVCTGDGRGGRQSGPLRLGGICMKRRQRLQPSRPPSAWAPPAFGLASRTPLFLHPKTLHHRMASHLRLPTSVSSNGLGVGDAEAGPGGKEFLV